MDIYIKMCKAATEIQEAWEPNPKDLYIDAFDDEKKKLVYNTTKEKIMGWNGIIWLPRIEDLMEMVLPEHMAELVPHTTISTTFDFNRIMSLEKWLGRSHEGPYKHNILTFNANELWLCFVMDILFNKSWSGMTWETA
jgi:hypothetical protein